MIEKKDLEIKYQAKENDQFYVEKKMKPFAFICKEVLVFGCITLAAYFSIFISSQKFATEESFTKSFNLIFEFFSIQNLIDTSIGLFIVMGILSFVNQLSTHSELNIQPILNRLITAITDFYYLMFSTILGCMFGLLHFISTYPSIEEYEALYRLSIKGISIIGIIGTATAIATQYLNNKNKILH